MNPEFHVHVKMAGFKQIDFDKRSVRKKIKRVAGIVRLQARALLSKRAVSEAGEIPGRRSGLLVRSIRVKLMSRGIMGAVVGPQRIAGMKEFYPIILIAGSETRNIQPRLNPMPEALEQRRSEVSRAVADALWESLKPR